jgi:hypothetical protein
MLPAFIAMLTRALCRTAEYLIGDESMASFPEGSLAD